MAELLLTYEWSHIEHWVLYQHDLVSLPRTLLLSQVLGLDFVS